MDTAQQEKHQESGSSRLGNAVGVPKMYWFIARMRRNNTEKATAAQLEKLGYETYVATRQEVRVWANGRRATVDRVVIPSTVFIKCTEAQRRVIVSMPNISHFMVNTAVSSDSGMRRPVARIADEEISKLRFMLGASDVPIGFVGHYVVGQAVRIIRGPLVGFEGVVTDGLGGVNQSNGTKDRTKKTEHPAQARIYINIDFLGATHLEISPGDLELVK